MNRSLKISIYLLVAAFVLANLSYFVVRWPLDGELLGISFLLLSVGSILFLFGLVKQIKSKQFPYPWLGIHLSTIAMLLLVIGILAWKNIQPHWWYATGTDIAEIRGDDYRVVSYGWPLDMRRIEYGTSHEGYFNVPQPLERSIPIPDLPMDIYLNIMHWLIILGIIYVAWEWGLSSLIKRNEDSREIF